MEDDRPLYERPKWIAAAFALLTFWGFMGDAEGRAYILAGLSAFFGMWLSDMQLALSVVVITALIYAAYKLTHLSQFTPEQYAKKFRKALKRYELPQKFEDDVVTGATELYAQEPGWKSRYKPIIATFLHPKHDPFIFRRVTLRAVDAFLKHLPKNGTSPFTTPVIGSMSKTAVIDLYIPFQNTWLKKLGLCEYVREYVQKAALKQAYEKSKKPDDLVWPREFKGDVTEAARIYLPPGLQKIAFAGWPLPLEDENRYMHHVVRGGSGTGKTTFISHLLHFDIQQATTAPRSVVFMDSQRRYIKEIQRLKVFAPGQPLHKKLLVIGPHNPVALNPFKSNLPRADQIAVLAYTFANVFETTDLQEGAATFLLQLVAETPNPSLNRLLELLDPDGIDPYREEIKRLSPAAQSFFRNWNTGVRQATKDGIRTRLQIFLEARSIAAMLNADECKVDLYDLTQKGTIILIDTDEYALKHDQMALFGRFFIGLMEQVMLRRFPFEEHTLTPTFFFVDEFHDYGQDPHFATLLRKSRKQRLGLVASYIRDADLLPSTAGLLQEARILTYLERQTEAPIHYRGGKTFTATVSKFDFKYQPRMSRDEYRVVLQEMEQAYGLKPQKPPRVRTPQSFQDT